MSNADYGYFGKGDRLLRCGIAVVGADVFAAIAA